MVGLATRTHTMASAQIWHESNRAGNSNGGAQPATSENPQDWQTPWPSRTGRAFSPNSFPMSDESLLVTVFYIFGYSKIAKFHISHENIPRAGSKQRTLPRSIPNYYDPSRGITFLNVLDSDIAHGQLRHYLKATRRAHCYGNWQSRY